MSAVTWALVPGAGEAVEHLGHAGVPGARSAAISAGTTQRLRGPGDRRGEADHREPRRPGTPVTVTCGRAGLRPTGRARAHDLPRLPDPTARVSVTSSTGPPGEARPTTVSWPWLTPTVRRPGRRRLRVVAVTVVSANGPAAAVTPGSRWWRRAGRRGLPVAVTWAPCWAANAWSNGALESTSRPSASVEAAVETSTTSPMTMACTRRPDSPPRAARTDRDALIAAPRQQASLATWPSTSWITRRA